MLKKYMAAFLACAIALTLSVPIIAGASSAGGVASPSSITASSGSVEANVVMAFEALMKTPKLDITISNHGALIMNPYRLAYTSGNVTDDFTTSADFYLDDYAGVSEKSSATLNPLDGDEVSYRQIISSPLLIESNTMVPVLVGVKVACNVTTGVTLQATRPITGVTNPNKAVKAVCMWLTAGTADGADGKEDTDAITAARIVDPFDTKYTQRNYTGPKPFIICNGAKGRDGTPTPVENKTMMTIPAAAVSEDDGRTIDAASYGCLLFDGEMIPMPTDNPWKSTDVITPTVTLNLQIQANEVDSSAVMGPMPSI